jgi:hypothetical protein
MDDPYFKSSVEIFCAAADLNNTFAASDDPLGIYTPVMFNWSRLYHHIEINPESLVAFIFDETPILKYVIAQYEVQQWLDEQVVLRAVSR